MEEQRLLKKKKKALNGSNRRNLAESCIELGNLYNNKGLYEKALYEYKESANIYVNMGMKLEYSQSNRMIGEMYMLLAEFDKALKYENIYLAIAQEINNEIEEQRALATLGRAYLLQGQSSNNAELSKNSLKSAQRVFLQSLSLCDRLKGKINSRELADMRARLLLNIGVVLEYLGNFDNALEYIYKSIGICKSQDLHELLCQCYITEGLLYSSKKNNHSKGIAQFNLALEVAGRLENKVLKKTEILFLKADALCKLSDFQSAKRILFRAWKMKSPNEAEHKDIERNLKIVAELCKTEDKLITTDSDDFLARKLLYEKMGDGACSLKNYDKAIDYYLLMLDNAEKGGDVDLQPIYYSLYQTYKDLNDYGNALQYIRKEYEIVKHNPKESCTTLINMAETMHLNKQPYEQIEDTLMQARFEAKNIHDSKLEVKCIKMLMKYQKELNLTGKIEQLKGELSNRMDLKDISDDSSDAESSEANSPDIGDDISIGDITDDSDASDEENVKPVTRKRGKGFTLKKNAKGESQLHQACIAGNLKLVTHLLMQGHPVNVRDNAGWLPIHEACIHGYKLIVEELIKHGANINDRGGTQCDGITPIYDAASNGHLDVVDSLLKHGASATIRTDGGDTPLSVLMRWRKKNQVNPADDALYESICERMKKHLDKIGLAVASQNLTQIIETPEINDIQTEYNSQVIDAPPKSRRRMAISSDSDDSLNSPKCSRKRLCDDLSDSSGESRISKKNKNSGVSAYINAMNLLKNKPTMSTSSKYKSPVKKSALLDSNEVGDDWLENDLIQSRTKKRRENESTRNSSETISPIKETNSTGTLIDLDFCNQYLPDNLEPSVVDSDDSDGSFTCGKGSLKRKWKRQTSLIRSGFSRINLGRIKSSTSNMQNRNREFEQFGEEPDSTTEVHISPVKFDLTNPVRHYSPQKFTQSISVKVRVKDKLLLIPIMNNIESSNISWLCNEVSKRYYNLEGVQPVLHLTTSDGAILADDDPLSIVSDSPELHANITGWNVPPLGKKYIKCCLQTNSAVDNKIKSILEASQATHVLEFSDLNLNVSILKPVFKALSHQSNLRVLNLSNNIIGNDGLKILNQCLTSLNNIGSINLSGNRITFEGIQDLLSAFKKNDKSMCQYLRELDLSFNCIESLGFNYLTKITKYIKLSSLNLKACNIECRSIHDIRDLNLSNIEHLDLSFNSFTPEVFDFLLQSLNPERLVSLHLEELKLNCYTLSQYIDAGSFNNFKELNLSRCNLTDVDLMHLLKSLSKCGSLEKLNLSYNKEITFLSLKKLLCENFKHLNLEGCGEIFQNIQESDLHCNWFTESNDRKIESLVLTANKSPVDLENVYNILDTMWSRYWNNGTLKKYSNNMVLFTKE